MITAKTFNKILSNVSNYQKLLESNLQKDKFGLNYYKIPTGYEAQYLKDIKFLREFDKNLLWDKSFWGMQINESISAIAMPTGNTLKYALKFALNNINNLKQ